MDRYDATDQHLVFEGISDGIDNKFGLEAIFYGMGFLTFIIIISLFIDLFFTSITSPILYSTFAPVRRRRRSLDSPPPPDSPNILRIPGWIQTYKPPPPPAAKSQTISVWNMTRLDPQFWASIIITAAIFLLSEQFGQYLEGTETESLEEYQNSFF